MNPLSRRAFLGSLAALPFIGRFFPQPLERGLCPVQFVPLEDVGGVHRFTYVWVRGPVVTHLEGEVTLAATVLYHDQDPDDEIGYEQ